MIRYHRFSCLLAIALCMPVSARAQTPAASAASAPLPGRASVKVDMVPSLIVMNAHGATLQGQALTLAGVSPNTIVFADRRLGLRGIC
jgi:hypothetical protein